jgi:hypothetical protein
MNSNPWRPIRAKLLKVSGAADPIDAATGSLRNRATDSGSGKTTLRVQSSGGGAKIFQAPAESTDVHKNSPIFRKFHFHSFANHFETF